MGFVFIVFSPTIAAPHDSELRGKSVVVMYGVSVNAFFIALLSASFFLLLSSPFSFNAVDFSSFLLICKSTVTQPSQLGE